MPKIKNFKNVGQSFLNDKYLTLTRIFNLTSKKIPALYWQKIAKRL